MNLNFKVLWFEDDPIWYRKVSEKLKSSIVQNYLNPLITNKVDKPGNDFDYNEFDLIIVDFALHSSSGLDVIKKIRDNSINVDILFYSGQYSRMKKELISENDYLDGIYLCDRKRDLFLRKSDNLINKIIRRSSCIENTRGVFMDLTSDFDEFNLDVVSEILNKLSHKKDIPIYKIAKEKILQMAAEKALSANKLEKQLNTVDDVCDYVINKNRRILEAEQRARLLDTMLKFIDKDKKFSDFFIKYKEDILCFRNGFAHSKNQDKTIKVCNDEYKLNSELYNKARKNLIIHQNKLDEIKLMVENFNEVIEGVLDLKVAANN